MFSIWLKLWSDLTSLTIESQRVIALRLMRIAGGGSMAGEEAQTMITEKMAASVHAFATLASGGSPSTVVDNYRLIVKANEKRLSAIS